MRSEEEIQDVIDACHNANPSWDDESLNLLASGLTWVLGHGKMSGEGDLNSFGFIMTYIGDKGFRAD